MMSSLDLLESATQVRGTYNGKLELGLASVVLVDAVLEDVVQLVVHRLVCLHPVINGGVWVRVVQHLWSSLSLQCHNWRQRSCTEEGQSASVLSHLYHDRECQRGGFVSIVVFIVDLRRKKEEW